jgi:hypothetical protein
MQYYETLHTESRNGFDIVFSVTHEDTHPRELFDDSIDDIDEMCRKIDDGYLAWFVARVQAFKNGVELASDYLGGCLYDNARDFVKESGGYYEDMIETVITEAKQKIEELASA